MIRKLFILFLFTSISCFSQKSSKKTYYFFEYNEISKPEFELLDKRKIFIKESENDSCIFKNVLLRKTISKLNTTQLNQITMFLTKIIGSDFKQDKITLIHLYRKGNNNIFQDSKYEKYWNWIEKTSHPFQSFLLGTKDSQIEVNNESHIYIDYYDLLEKLFFKDSDFNINHLLLKPNGEIYIFFGIDDILHVLDWSVD